MDGPRHAMVLAAGLGTRMRPITDRTPKPLVEIAGRTLLDRGLDMLAQAGVEEAIVNVHHLGDQIERHVAKRIRPRIRISDERDQLLDSAGGIVKALPLLRDEPFFLINADTFWRDAEAPELARLASRWDAARMDVLMLLADPARATGHEKGVDFVIDAEGRLARAKGAAEGRIYAGVAILQPRIFAGVEPHAHSLNLYFDRAIGAGRMFGLVMEGWWITVGTPQAIADAEAALARLDAERA